MRYLDKHFVGGEWIEPIEGTEFLAVNPATEQQSGVITCGSARDLDRAVAAARKAFPAWSVSSVAERVSCLRRILEEYKKRTEELAQAVTEEMGSPIGFARERQVLMGPGHLEATITALEKFDFEWKQGRTTIRREAIGVCGLITPWNYPLNSVACKVAPAIAAGCSMVLKPSEYSSFSAQIFAEIIEAAGLPAGVFNLVYGDGPTVGNALTSHPGVDMISFTGSTRGGVEVARSAAPTVKRVCQELGGKSPNVFLDDADFEAGVAAGAGFVMMNSGQTCVATTRMIVPRSKLEEVKALAIKAAESVSVGNPLTDVTIGPLVSLQQWKRVQSFIQKGLDEGATAIVGGPGRPNGLNQGYYVRPTVFADATNDMTISQEEIFGPVLTIIAYDDEDEAIEIANDSPYGLFAAVQSSDPKRAKSVADKLRAGAVYVNTFNKDFSAPNGGFKQSGNGREFGSYGIEEYLETKAIVGP